MPQKHSYQYIKNFINNEGYELLSSDYINIVEKLTLKCPKGHIFPMSFKVFRAGHRCSYCAGKRQYNVDEIRGFFEKRGYTLISKEYVNNKEKLDVIGPDGNKYQTTLFSFKVNNIMPHLKGKIFKNEEECRQIFENITQKKFPKSSPSWAISPQTNRSLELDGYCEELKIAFEYDGAQHFKSHHMFKKDTIEDRHNRDTIKNELCIKNQIRLIRIPHYIKDKYSFIKNEIKNSNKTLYIGDPHATINNLAECEKLFKFVIKTARDKNINHIVILGDLFHSHGVKRLEVEDFWMRTVKEVLKQFKLTILIGNHDMILGTSKFAGLNSISAFKQQYTYTLNIIDVPTIIDNIAYIPYTSNLTQFVEDARDLYNQGATKTLIAHQTFTGLTYDNGFYAEDGIELELILQEQIISGHIHTKQTIGKCMCPGSPKWDFMTDANIEKGIWVFDHNNDGSVKNKEFISTKDVVTPINKYTVKEGEEVPELNEKAKNYIEFHGKTAWINKMKKKYKGVANIKGKPVDRKIIKSEIDKNLTLLEYLNKEFKPIRGVDKRDIDEYLKTI